MDGIWGTVCDDGWGLEEANVVCKKMGFEGALQAPCCAHFGQGIGPIFLDDVRCIGRETNITDCQHEGIGVHDCTHAEDASVICLPLGENEG